MLLQYSSLLFGSVALFLIFSFQTTTSASPIETSWPSDVSPYSLHKRVPPGGGDPTNQRKCSTIFGSPSFTDCEAAIGQLPRDDQRQNAINRQFFNHIGDHSPHLPNEYLPRVYQSGHCAVMLTTMSLIKNGHFDFIVGNIPVGTSDISNWGQVRSVSDHVNAYCVKDPPQGKKLGGIQRAGRNLDLAVILFGPGLYAEHLSILYGINWDDPTPPHQLQPAPGATS